MYLKSKYIKENYLVYTIYFVSVVFFMRVMMDLTWFEDELKGYWFIKRLIFSAILSSGYLLQIKEIKNILPRISRILFVSTFVFSILWPIIGSLQTRILFFVFSFLIFLKNWNFQEES